MNVMPKILKNLIPRESRPERVGPRITALRETVALTKAEFADSIELDRSTLTKIENGAMGLDITRAEIVSALYGFGMNFIYLGDLSDVPADLRPTLLINLDKLRTN